MVAKVFLEHRQTILNSLQTALLTVKPLFNPLKPLFFCLFVSVESFFYHVKRLDHLVKLLFDILQNNFKFIRHDSPSVMLYYPTPFNLPINSKTISLIDTLFLLPHNQLNKVMNQSIIV